MDQDNQERTVENMDQYNQEMTDEFKLIFPIIIADKKLFERLFLVFKENCDSKTKNDKAIKILKSSSILKGLDIMSFLDLFVDFSFWLRELIKNCR